MLHEGEILTDNTQIETCNQCADCIYWGHNEDPYSNAFDKLYCDKYPHGKSRKPMWVVDNYGDCDYRQTE